MADLVGIHNAVSGFSESPYLRGTRGYTFPEILGRRHPTAWTKGYHAPICRLEVSKLQSEKQADGGGGVRTLGNADLEPVDIVT